ncbi:MAG: hypothetical protein ABL925_17225, partial [Methylococcales bacterium]
GYGHLTKEIRLENGKITKDSTQCFMAHGEVARRNAANLLDFSEQLKSLPSNIALAIGVTDACADEQVVRIVKKGFEVNGAISRSKDYFRFHEGESLIMLDYDAPKDQPALSINVVYGLLLKLVPELEGCEVLALGSTSSGIYLEGETPPTSSTGGIHIYIRVSDGTKISELGKLIAGRCWIQGLGRFDVSKSGALLARVLFDESVFSPERLIFEAAPVLGDGVKQLPRIIKYWPGGVLKADKIQWLTLEDEAKIEAIKTAAKAAKAVEAQPIKAAHDTATVIKLVKAGLPKRQALEQVSRANRGILSGTYPLYFENVDEISVVDVLRSPALFHGLNLSCPGEGDADLGKSRFYLNENSKIINTFRHGGGTFYLEREEIRWNPDDQIGMFAVVCRILSAGRFPDIFIFNGGLTHVGDDGCPRSLTSTTAPLLCGRLVRFFKDGKTTKGQAEKERVTVYPPDRFWKGFIEWGNWNLPKLTAVTKCPFPWGDAVVVNSGYHQPSGLFLAEGFDILIGDVGHEDALKSLKYLQGLTAGFPYKTDIDRSVDLAYWLTALMRPLLPKAPAFAISATSPGTGKTEKRLGVASLQTGALPALHAFKDNEPETAKMLTSALLQGTPSILIDNIKIGCPVQSDALCAVLSSENFVDRELGVSRIRQMGTRSLVALTGNNLLISGDLTRRTLMVRLDAGMERPEIRVFDKAFTTTCLDNRNEIIKALLTILKAFNTVKPTGLKYCRLGSFEVWSDAVAAVLVWLGLDDPSLGLAKPENDEILGSYAELVDLWRREIPYEKITVVELLRNPALSAWFREYFDDKGGSSSRKVGKLLSK